MSKLSHSLVMLALCLASNASAGNLEAKQQGKTLRLRGDGAGVSFSLQGGGAALVEGRVRVAVGGTDTLNGQTRNLTFDGVSNVSVSFGGGENLASLYSLLLTGSVDVRGGGLMVAGKVSAKSLSFDLTDDLLRMNCRFGGDVQLALGDGNNDVRIEDEGMMQPRARSLSMKLGGGDDQVVFVGGRVDKDIKIDLGGGSNECWIADSNTSGSVTLKGGSGHDRVDVDTFFASRNMKLALGGGANSMTVVEATIQKGIVAEAGGGDDVVRLDDVNLPEGLTLKLGNGDNSLELKKVVGGRKFAYSGGSGSDVIVGENVGMGGDWSIRAAGSEARNAFVMSQGAISGSVSVTGGAGDELVSLQAVEIFGGTRIAGRLDVSSGAGDDMVDCGSDGEPQMGSTRSTSARVRIESSGSAGKFRSVSRRRCWPRRRWQFTAGRSCARGRSRHGPSSASPSAQRSSACSRAGTGAGTRARTPRRARSPTSSRATRGRRTQSPARTGLSRSCSRCRRRE